MHTCEGSLARRTRLDDTGGYSVVSEEHPRVTGEAHDSVSAFAQVQMSDVPGLLKLPDTECPTVGIRLPRYRRPKHWDNVDEPMARLERNLCGHPLAGLLWERRLGEVSLQEDCERVLLQEDSYLPLLN